MPNRLAPGIGGTSRREQHHDFLNPLCQRDTFDRYHIRRSILSMLLQEREHFSGTLLDVGCGEMPYREILTAPPSRVVEYIGLDLPESTFYRTRPDLEWDGRDIPLADASVECAMATEVLEHCPDPAVVLREVFRVLKAGGRFIFTVPFLWPLHNVPYDEYRYTPFALRRLLEGAGFGEVAMNAHGGWDASLAQMIGLWARRRPMSRRKRTLASAIARPIVRFLSDRDNPTSDFGESMMITGLAGVALKGYE